MATANVSDFYLACRNGDSDMVRHQLPNIPVKVLNTLEANGSTCLHAAAYHGHKDIVRLLLAHGASRRITNRYGCTPLDEAKTQEIANLFPRSGEALKKRYSDSPAQQPEWQFAQNSAESFARATNWGCIKDRGIKKTIKKIRKAQALDDDPNDPSTKIVQNHFNEALQTKNPIPLLKAYTVESQFYKRLNNEMATGTPREVFKKLTKKWTGYYTGVIANNSAFNNYRFQGETYRGMQINPSDFAQYRQGVALSNKSFQSTSKSLKIAQGFALPSRPTPGKIPVLIVFEITDPRSALSIETISEYQNEEEVLIVPGTLFLVAYVNQDELPYEVHLKQLEWKDEF